MGKTSIKDYIIASILLVTIVATIGLSYLYVSPNYDVSDIDTSSLSVMGDFNATMQMISSNSASVYETNADSSLFDILGGLVVKALGSIRAFINIIGFSIGYIGNILGNSFFAVPYPIRLAVIGIITTTLASVFLFRYISGKEDEK